MIHFKELCIQVICEVLKVFFRGFDVGDSNLFQLTIY